MGLIALRCSQQWSYQVRRWDPIYLDGSGGEVLRLLVSGVVSTAMRATELLQVAGGLEGGAFLGFSPHNSSKSQPTQPGHRHSPFPILPRPHNTTVSPPAPVPACLRQCQPTQHRADSAQADSSPHNAILGAGTASASPHNAFLIPEIGADSARPHNYVMVFKTCSYQI